MKDEDNLGNFFNADDFNNEEENADNWKPVKVNGNALFKKAIDILNLIESLCDVMPEDDAAAFTKRLMRENVLILPGKIKGGMAVDDVYSMVMENAVIIKINMVELKTQLWACNTLHGVDETYIAVLNNEIEVFKKIFIKWVLSFDKENDLPDDWYIFNDPSTFPEN